MPQPEFPSGSKLPGIVAQSQTRSQPQLKINPNHRAPAMAWALVADLIMTTMVQSRQIPPSPPALQCWKYLCTPWPFRFFVSNFSPSEEQCHWKHPALEKLVKQSFMRATRNFYFDWLWCWKKEFEKGRNYVARAFNSDYRQSMNVS